MGFIHDACSNDAIGLSGLESVMNAQRDGQKEPEREREREREQLQLYKSRSAFERLSKLPANDTTKGKLSNTQ